MFGGPKLMKISKLWSKSCEPCQLNRNEPDKHSSYSWQYPAWSWKCIHIDYCGPFRGHMYLIVVDAYSKWPEVIRMSTSTSTSETIKSLLSLFSRHGLPDKLVSDNGPQFTSEQFKGFMTNGGILHIKRLHTILKPTANMANLRLAMRRSRAFCSNL